jgi:hypothetical protein
VPKSQQIGGKSDLLPVSPDLALDRGHFALKSTEDWSTQSSDDFEMATPMGAIYPGWMPIRQSYGI